MSNKTTWLGWSIRTGSASDDRSPFGARGLCSVIAAAFLLAAPAAGGALAQDAAPYYEGKTIKLLVPTSPGGGTDTTARLLAPLLQKFIPGNPSVFVENRAGGGGIIGTNHFVEAEPHDGTTVLVVGSGAMTAYVLKDPMVKYDIGAMKPILGFSFGGVIYLPAATGVKEPADILTVKEPLRFAGTSPVGNDLRYLMALDMLGVKYDTIFGFQGGGDGLIAFERGEGNIGTDTLLSYKKNIQPRVDAGEIIPIMSTGLTVNGKLERVPALADVPTAAELYESVTGKTAEGPNWEAYKLLVASNDSLSKGVYFHADVPPEAVEAMDGAIKAIFSDAETAKALANETAGNPPLLGAELQAAMEIVRNPDPSTVKWLRDYVAERWDYKMAE